MGHGQDGRATNEEEPEPQWLVERLIGVFIFSEANEALQAVEAWNRRVEEAFRGLEGALQKSLERTGPRIAD